MVHEVSIYDFELPEIEDWLAGDDRTLAFQVVDGDGNAVDISTATVSFGLFDREYEDDAADAVVSDGDSSVEVVTDSRVDTVDGEFVVHIDGEATEDDIYGEYYQRAVVEQSDGTLASWRGRVIITA